MCVLIKSSIQDLEDNLTKLLQKQGYPTLSVRYIKKLFSLFIQNNQIPLIVKTLDKKMTTNEILSKHHSEIDKKKLQLLATSKSINRSFYQTIQGLPSYEQLFSSKISNIKFGSIFLNSGKKSKKRLTYQSDLTNNQETVISTIKEFKKFMKCLIQEFSMIEELEKIFYENALNEVSKINGIIINKIRQQNLGLTHKRRSYSLY